MSHSQFHCTGRVYLDMHGLIFETSICYWQDQPGSGTEISLRLAARQPPNARPPARTTHRRSVRDGSGVVATGSDASSGLPFAVQGRQDVDFFPLSFDASRYQHCRLRSHSTARRSRDLSPPRRRRPPKRRPLLLPRS